MEFREFLKQSELEAVFQKGYVHGERRWPDCLNLRHDDRQAVAIRGLGESLLGGLHSVGQSHMLGTSLLGNARQVSPCPSRRREPTN